MVTGRLGAGFGWMLFLWAMAAVLALPISVQAQQLSASPPLHAKAAAQPAPHRGDLTPTKFIIGLERQVEFQISSLTNPNRVFVDLPDVKMDLPVLPGDTPVGLVKSFRGGASAPGRARIVIDVTSPVVVEKAVIERSKDGRTVRLVLDIAPAPESKATTEMRAIMRAGVQGLGAAGVQPPLPKPAKSPQVRAAGSFKPVVVVDPGHGGEDSGARKFGTVEKDVVLSFSLMLRDKLIATGRYRVVMTRETDVFIPLEERRAIAERNGAHLFIAVHADYAHSGARGATIYSLRESVADSLRSSAKGEVGESVMSSKTLAAIRRVEGDVGAIKDWLVDLARREVELNRERTSTLVKSVIADMGESTNMKENPDRTAAFVVIRTAKVPSILIELGYVTNEADAEQLRSDVWRDKVSTSILTAIENYFGNRLAKLPM